MEHPFIVFLILLITRFLDRVSAQYIYFLSLKSELISVNSITSLENNIGQFYILKGFWNFFWWVFVVISLFTIVINFFFTVIEKRSSVLDEDEGNEEENEDNGGKTSKPRARKRPRRPSHRYKSKRFKA